ncbi:hypothetical protein SAMN05216359_110144 [Roseateles sp. YR242]|uniref:MFS transporter n=1 Tax=Roseateles sp. YR242 TaxID=1855305 RepID=UPI0008C8135E|nr:MFS transporter [Roseateles sp. YR242]SEL52186.1 hypothetical protein SAMN05216359_110144 [Roseateles sp. YR242]
MQLPHYLHLRGILGIPNATLAFMLTVAQFKAAAHFPAFVGAFLLATVPALVLMVLVGRQLDRFDKRHALVLMELLPIPMFLLILTQGQANGLWTISLQMAVLNISGTFRWLSTSSGMAHWTAHASLPRCNAIQEFWRTFTTVIGTLIGGTLIGVVPGSTTLLLMMGVCLSVSLCMAGLPLLLSSGATPDGRRPMPLNRTGAARFIFRDPQLRTLTLFFVFFNVALGASAVLLTPYLLNTLGPGHYAFYLAAQALGAAAAVPVFRMPAFKHRPERVVFGGSAAYALGLMLMGTQVHETTLLSVGAVLGLLGACIPAASNTLWQRRTPQGDQAAVFSVRLALSLAPVPVAALVAAGLLQTVTGAAASAPLSSLSQQIGLAIACIGLGAIPVCLLFAAASTPPQAHAGQHQTNH